MTDKEREAIISRIRKLLDLAKDKGASEAEAALAMQKANELLIQHSLSEADIKKAAPSEKLVVTTIEIQKNYEIGLVQAVARLNFCKCLATGQKNKRSMPTHHMFFGEDIDVRVTIMTCEYLRNTTSRLATNEWNANKDRLGGETTRVRFRRAFRIACYTRLEIRIAQLIRDRLQGETKSTEGTNLPALMSMYEQKQLRVKEELEKAGIKETDLSVRANAVDAHGRMLGDKAGREISLDRQISGSSAPAGYIK